MDRLISFVIGLLFLTIGIIGLKIILKKNPDAYNTTEAYVFIDKTTSQLEPLTASDIFPLLSKDKSMYSKSKVKCFILSNYQYNKAQSLELPFRFIFFSNERKRNKEITQFKTDLDTLLQSIYKSDTGRAKSSIYEPLIREANTLSKSDAGVKLIITESDLIENTNQFSLYRESDYIQLQKEPMKVLKRLEQQQKLQNVQGMAIYFIYQPKDDADNDRFMLMANFYKTLFEKHGAEVYIGSNISL